MPRRAVKATNCTMKATDCLRRRLHSSAAGNDGIKLPSQGKRLHKEGKLLPCSRHPPPSPTVRRQFVAQRRPFYAQRLSRALRIQDALFKSSRSTMFSNTGQFPHQTAQTTRLNMCTEHVDRTHQKSPRLIAQARTWLMPTMGRTIQFFFPQSPLTAGYILISSTPPRRRFSRLPRWRICARPENDASLPTN